MKYSKIVCSILAVCAVIALSCRTTEKAVPAEAKSVIEEESVPMPQEAEQPASTVPEAQPAEESAPVPQEAEQPANTVPETQSAEDAEYSRSISALNDQKVSFDEFQRDKADILAVISDLDKSMQKRDYGLWRGYLAPDSASYWSNKLNLQVIAAKLPKKGVALRTLGDYFSHVFIPSRINRKVNEIRYISPSEVKAVEVDGSKDIIYYEFEKIDGRWFLKLPILQ